MSTAPLLGTGVPFRKAVHGTGRAELHAFGDNAHFAELSYTYPLKLLSPRPITAGHDEASQRVAILYNLSYGGGLIGGDRVELSIDVRAGAKLVLLTQGSTKIFPSRPAQRLSSGTGISSEPVPQHTLQRMSAQVAPSAFLVMLPDPVTPFRGASYSQTQIFRLAEASKTGPGGSLLLLDWFTSGRKARGEEWQFDRYRSVNEVHLGDRTLACDVLLLEQKGNSSGSHSQNARLPTSLAPYSCYATVIMFGVATKAISNSLREKYDTLTQMQRRIPESLIWSFSPLEDGDGCIVRVAGTETDAVRQWLRDALRGLESQIGSHVYSKAFL